MTDTPPIALSRLRTIGWREWDPIGLLAAGEAWDHKPFADEYDAYLLKVAGDLRRGGGLREAVAYLLSVERDHMAIGDRPGQDVRAETTARAIQDYLADVDRPHSAPADGR
ncbi:hypothetical protein [Methylobacterium aquaticum]|uniref:Uncharacterized protein n=1 Tax=Methylobacterium aquaticum TaxID=270351 RepID=A0A0J6SZI4_9HYPH|nr:hypothetical protein [Methylobacterium aquaticum]KMO40600.1 hypothetical protein VP06_02590 [Methylobacterium aquaticum]